MAKPAVKHCDAGHRQTTRWKPEKGCLTCQQSALFAARAAQERAEQEALGPPPSELVLRSGDGKSVQYFRIPKHLRPRKRRGR